MPNSTVICVVCKKIHKRSNVNDWVYHDSIGVVCINHRGVKEWYDKLLAELDRDISMIND